jgi:CRP-like cAMP-binding protein
MRFLSQEEDQVPLAAAQRESLIGACPLFTGLDESGLAAVSAAAVEVDFPADRVIAREGEIGTGLFIIGGGRVRVMRDGQAIAHLGPGEFFGELSVLDGGPRNATVITDEPTTCLALATWDAERVLREQPGVALTVLRVLARRLREATSDHRT